MKTYEEFEKTIMEYLQRDIPEPKAIMLQKVQKLNGISKDGLIILEKGMNLSPTIYLHEFYEIYESGVNLDKVYAQILDVYRKNRPERRIDAGFFTDFERAKDSVLFKLIHYEKNKELLQDVPHIRFLDLAIVCYCLVFIKPEIGSATILIHNAHLGYWNITEQELFEIAKKNTQEQFPAQFFVMPSLEELESSDSDGLFESTTPELDVEEIKMYVVTNKADLYGAGCILYKDFLHELAERAEVDFYILPSSVHETILVPTLNDECMDYFNKMVKEVNQAQLAPDEILSDHAYYYSRAERKIMY